MRRASLSRARCAAGSTFAEPLPAAAAGTAVPCGRGLVIWITVTGAPSSFLQPSFSASLAEMVFL
jgi:hypothetical protein